MDLTHALLLIVAGVAGGTISSLVGGAALVTYPALLAVGVPPVTATVCNLVALSPGNGFGPGGEGYVRFALVENEKRIQQAIRQIRKGLTKLG